MTKTNAKRTIKFWIKFWIKLKNDGEQTFSSDRYERMTPKLTDTSAHRDGDERRIDLFSLWTKQTRVFVVYQ